MIAPQISNRISLIERRTKLIKFAYFFNYSLRHPERKLNRLPTTEDVILYQTKDRFSQQKKPSWNCCCNHSDTSLLGINKDFTLILNHTTKLLHCVRIHPSPVFDTSKIFDLSSLRVTLINKVSSLLYTNLTAPEVRFLSEGFHCFKLSSLN